MTNKWYNISKGWLENFSKGWLENFLKEWLENRFDSKTLEQINEWQNKVKSTLEVNFTEEEVLHIVQLNSLLNKMEIRKNSMIDILDLILDYNDSHEWFTYENELASKLVVSNLNIVLKKLNIDISIIDFDMVREYKLKNPKK